MAEAGTIAGVRQELFLPKHLLERIPPYLVWTWSCEQCAAHPYDREASASEKVAQRSARRHNQIFHADASLDPGPRT